MRRYLWDWIPGYDPEKVNKMARIDRPLRVGVIGSGGIANSHIQGYLKAENVELHATCDVIESRAKGVAEKYGFKHHFTSWEEMIKTADLDAVSICTPPFAHIEPTIGALEAGLHVMCEKPMALDSVQAQQMVEVWHRVRGKHHNLFSVGFQSRFGRNAQTLKRFIDAGELGDVYYAKAAYLRRRGVPAWGVFTSKALNGGGPMIDIGVHALDLSMWLMGHPPVTSVYGVSFTKFGNRPNVFNPWGKWDPAKYDVEDSAFAMIRFANGAALQLEVSWVLNLPKSSTETLICGTDGGAQLDPLTIFQEKHGTIVDVVVPEKATEGQDASREPNHVHQMIGWIEAIREGTSPLVLPEQALMVSKIVDAVYTSSETGVAVQF
jgi:predicted dehydrogenase